MHIIRFQFEELPGFHRGGFFAGSFNGFADIEYADDGDWMVTAFTLECCNQKLGPSAQAQTVELSNSYDKELWSGLLECLGELQSDFINDAICADMERRGISIADPNAEHHIREAV